MTQIRKQLIEIKESQSYDQLEPFKEKAVWTQLEKDDKSLLAHLLIKQGEQQLASGNQQVLKNFEHAAQISSYDPHILIRQGKILASYPENVRCLILAREIFSQVIHKNPEIFDAWYQRACILIQIGQFENEMGYFNQANDDFLHAESLIFSVPENCLPQFYWKWALCLKFLGKLSGEPFDFHQAIEKFKLSASHGSEESSFYNDYGLCLVYFASLVGQSHYYNEALSFFEKSISNNRDYFDGWYNQACCLLTLHDNSPSDELVEQAELSFARAAEICPHDADVWLKWGQLDAAQGKIKRDVCLLRSAFEKFERGFYFDSDSAAILQEWADTELFLGSYEERLDLIYSAQEKILKSLAINSNSAFGWYLYGVSLSELARYFSDAQFFLQAIEKFQYGLALFKTNLLLWHGLALAYFSLGELTEQQDPFEKSVYYFSKGLECGGEGVHYWNDWGLALMRLGEISGQAHYVEMAIEKFEKILKQPLQKIEEEGVDLEWICHYGCALDLLGDLKDDPHYFERAVQVLTQVLQFDPDYQQARYNLALSLFHLGEAMYDAEPYALAVEHFECLLKLDPEDEMIHMDFGVALVSLGLLVYDSNHPKRSQGLYHQAEHHLMQAVMLGNALAYYQLAGLYSITKHFDLAMQYLIRTKQAGVLPAIEDLLHDEWLEPLSHSNHFRQFIQELGEQNLLDNDDN